MKVLSLFDGISCAQIALNRVGINYEKYWASEIDPSSLLVAKKNYPRTVQLGDIVNIKVKKRPNIGLLIGGSPCQDLSHANVNGSGLDGERSGLFWEYVRLLREIKPKYFILENVVMKSEWEQMMSDAIGVQPIEINSNLVSAQNRRRLYWTNIPVRYLPKDKGLLIKDIIYDDTYKIFTDVRITRTKKLTKNYVKWDMSGKRYWSQQDRAYFKDGKMCTLPKYNPANKLNIVLDYEKDLYRRIHPIEAERLQTVPDNYTQVDGITASRRLEMLGNGFTVDVIAYILSHVKDDLNAKA